MVKTKGFTANLGIFSHSDLLSIKSGQAQSTAVLRSNTQISTDWDYDINKELYHSLFILKCFTPIYINLSSIAWFQFQSRAEERCETTDQEYISWKYCLQWLHLPEASKAYERSFLAENKELM